MSYNTIKLPGYKQFNENEEIPHSEATVVRIRLEFKNKLKSLTQRANRDQEFCEACPTLPPSATQIQRKSILPQITTNMAVEDKPRERSSNKSLISSRSQGLRSESMENLKVDLSMTSRVTNLQRIPHDENSNIMAAFTNLHVAHEIAINRCFRLKKLPKTEAVANVTDVAWELVADEAESQNGHYPASLSLLAELKDSLISLMMPHNHELREQVHQVLDLERISKEAATDPLDYDCYLGYALEVLGQVCCPSRDKEVEQVRQIKEPLLLFQTIFKLIDNMKIDMDNFFISLYRPVIVRMVIETERKKFADFLELEYRLHDDGLKATRAWLLRHRVGVRDAQTVIAKAYGEILNWTTSEVWPETLFEDIERFQEFRKSLEQIGIVGGIILEMGKIFHKIFKTPPPTLRQVFSRYIKLLIPVRETSDAVKLQRCLENVAEKTAVATQKIIAKYLKRSMSPEERAQIKDSVTKVADPENNFRNLIIRRIVDYAEEVILAAHEYHAALPSTLSPVMYEVAYLVNGFYRVVLHNRNCFEEVYRDIIDDRNRAPFFPEENDWNWDSGLLGTLKKLRAKITTPAEAERLERDFSQFRIRQYCEAHQDSEVCSAYNATEAEKVFEAEDSLPNVAEKSTSFSKTSGFPLRKPKYDLQQQSFHEYMEDADPYNGTTEDNQCDEMEEEAEQRLSLFTEAKLQLEKLAFEAFCSSCTECGSTVEKILHKA